MIYKKEFEFTFANLEKMYQKVIDNGYQIITCQEYALRKEYLQEKILVNRVDIDFSIVKTKKIIDLFNKLSIKGSFFLRLHAPEYNPFSFENYKVIKYLLDSGHELGYHSEVVDQSVIWSEDAEKNLVRDIEIINRMFNIKIAGVASHGANTGCDNLDFWVNKRPQDFGLLYEAYDKEPSFNLFFESTYITDSAWIKWKTYNRGILKDNDTRDFSKHSDDMHPLIYLLIHPDTFFDSHFYESE
jgi:hypothetical protein